MRLDAFTNRNALPIAKQFSERAPSGATEIAGASGKASAVTVSLRSPSNAS